MKLIRFGEPGEEKPGLQLEDGTRVEIPPGFGDYDETFFGGDGLEQLKNGRARAPSLLRKSILRHAWDLPPAVRARSFVSD